MNLYFAPSNYPTSSVIITCAASLIVATFAARSLTRFGFSIPDEGVRIGRLDGLRGYLALFVMLHHAIIWLNLQVFGYPWGSQLSSLFNNFGQGCVSLFFMTTGLLFYPRILRGFKATNWTSTFLARLFRIYPMVVLVVAFIVLMIYIRSGFILQGHWRENARALVEWLCAWAERPMFGYADSGRLNAYVLWSLRYELLFYVLVLPAMALARDLTRGFLPSWCLPAALTVIAMVARTLLRAPGFFDFLPLFALGMFAFELRLRPHVASVLASRSAAIVSSVGLVLAASLEDSPWFPPQIVAYGAFFACVSCDNDFGGAFATKGARALGEISYPIYMLHGLVLNIFFVDIFPWLGLNALAEVLASIPFQAGLVVFLCAAVNVTIERPFIQVGKGVTRGFGITSAPRAIS